MTGQDETVGTLKPLNTILKLYFINLPYFTFLGQTLVLAIVLLFDPCSNKIVIKK